MNASDFFPGVPGAVPWNTCTISPTLKRLVGSGVWGASAVLSILEAQREGRGGVRTSNTSICCHLTTYAPVNVRMFLPHPVRMTPGSGVFLVKLNGCNVFFWRTSHKVWRLRTLFPASGVFLSPLTGKALLFSHFPARMIPAPCVFFRKKNGCSGNFWWGRYKIWRSRCFYPASGVFLWVPNFVNVTLRL